MERIISGDVVIVPFPFSDLSSVKRRPALVLKSLNGDDYILCQITSKQLNDRYSINCRESDFKAGGLKRPSNIRINRLFTAEKSLILYKAGSLKKEFLNDVITSVIRLFQEEI
ncbi:MAG: growth inhibitor PemK [Spirochaetes bacterium GWF1_49_6]|nr:MAG: growth inhibitor PemK [Spirochaetes bacterium GWF1_49_6]